MCHIGYRAATHFRYLFQKKVTNDEINNVYGDSTPSMSTIKYSSVFYNDEHRGRPKHQNWSVKSIVLQLAVDDRRVTVREIT